MSEQRAGFRVQGSGVPRRTLCGLAAGAAVVFCMLAATMYTLVAHATPATATAVTYPKVVTCDPNGLTVALDTYRPWTFMLVSGSTCYLTYAADVSGIALDATAQDNKAILSSDVVIVVGEGTAAQVCIAPASGTSTVQIMPGARTLQRW